MLTPTHPPIDHYSEASSNAVQALFSYAGNHSSKTHATAQKNTSTKATYHSDASTPFGNIYGNSDVMAEVFKLIECVAPSYASVMIIGPSGCGKELVAQTIHEKSTCAQGPFVPINCGALPATLIESELFGYEKGAFTGANKTHQGFFERAHEGTLFLDEITEMPIELQVKLLRALETGYITRVGGNSEIGIKVRVLAATNRDPQHAVQQGLLREDLFYRLAVFPIVIPSLSERGNDVCLLAQHFLHQLNEQYQTSKYFAESVANALVNHTWPGNVRELRNSIQRAYLMSDEIISIDHALTPLAKINTRKKNVDVVEFEIGTSLETVEREWIFATLDRYNGNKSEAANALGISLKTIYNRLNSYIDSPQSLPTA